MCSHLENQYQEKQVRDDHLLKVAVLFCKWHDAGHHRKISGGPSNSTVVVVLMF